MSKNNLKHKKPKKTFETIYENLINSKQSCPLVISGNPGTGKSTLLSLLYLELRKDKRYWTHFIDLHYFDEISTKITNDKLQQDIQYITENIGKNEHVVLFID
jgi:DNA replication protein DnaC